MTLNDVANRFAQAIMCETNYTALTLAIGALLAEHTNFRILQGYDRVGRIVEVKKKNDDAGTEEIIRTIECGSINAAIVRALTEVLANSEPEGIFVTGVSDATSGTKDWDLPPALGGESDD